MIEEIKNKMRALPAMDILLSQDWVASHCAALGRETVKELFSQVLVDIRRDLLEGKNIETSLDSINAHSKKIFAREAKRKLVPVVNATGVVIHTNLGRSCLSSEAVEAVAEIARSYSTLEFDLESGTRGSRNALVEGLLCRATGAEAGLVVNNNAAAVVLCLSALAAGREVVVSRGELVEIGGSFRVPDIMEFSGAKLAEVGTTNRTHLKDYSSAINERTCALLKVHPSNFRIEGFTASVPRRELAELAHERGVILIEDAGSGLLIDGARLGLDGEDSIRACIEDGADIVTFSGDKMLGGPQIGAIVGKRELVDRLRKAQILRALRVDKMTLAAFEITLRTYLRGDIEKIPVVAMLSASEENLRERAEKFAALLKENFGSNLDFSVIQVKDAVGGGSYPAKDIMGWGVAVSDGSLHARLRTSAPAVVAGAQDNAVVFHMRTLLEGDEAKIIEAMKNVGN